jgi:hypothetical protein
MEYILFHVACFKSGFPIGAVSLGRVPMGGHENEKPLNHWSRSGKHPAIPRCGLQWQRLIRVSDSATIQVDNLEI